MHTCKAYIVNHLFTISVFLKSGSGAWRCSLCCCCCFQSVTLQHQQQLGDPGAGQRQRNQFVWVSGEKFHRSDGTSDNWNRYIYRTIILAFWPSHWSNSDIPALSLVKFKHPSPLIGEMLASLSSHWSNDVISVLWMVKYLFRALLLHDNIWLVRLSRKYFWY